MPEVEVNGITAYYEEEGSGPPLVLVHGLGASTELWRRVAPELATEFRVITYDLRGAGRSQLSPGPFALDDLASDLDAFVEARELESVTVVGHSMSGAVVLAYAAGRPDRVRAVVGVGAVAELPETARAGMRERAELVRGGSMSDVADAVASNGTDPSWRDREPEEYSRFRDAVAANDPEGYAALALVVADLDVSDILGQIAAPVLLIAGGTDPVSPPEANQAIVERLADAHYVSIPECGHIIPLERPRELLDTLTPFALDPVQGV